jgi:16S rRNA processing protein RimM
VAAEPTVAVGRITKPHGVHGEVAVLVMSEVPDRFAPGAIVYTEDGSPMSVESARPHGSRLLVRFVEVPDRAAADAVRGRLLVVPQSALPELPEGSWWPHQLEGSEVVTEAGRILGTLVDVVLNPANDLWVVRDGEHEILVPAIRDVVLDVDADRKRVTVRAVPGLTVDDEAPSEA